MTTSRFTSSGRLHFIDASRAGIMLLVFLSHFGMTYFDAHDGRAGMMERIGLIASPTFVLISGALVGFLYRTRPGDFDWLRAKLIDRGLFLLTVGRLLMVIGCWPLMHTARHILITDVVGISMIIGPLFVRRFSAQRRLAIAAASLSVTWLVIGGWHPSSVFGEIVQETFFGSLHPLIYAYAFPLVPWVCLDLVGSAIGDQLGVRYMRGDLGGMSRLLNQTAVAGMVVSAVGKGVYILAMNVAGGAHHTLVTAVQLLTLTTQKVPPSPGYFCFNGGIGMGLVSVCLLAERRGWLRRLMTFAIALGQASLVMFVIQFFVYFSLMYPAHSWLPFRSAWSVYLVVSMAMVIVPSWEWHRRGYRRFITVGYLHWWEQRQPLWTSRGRRLAASRGYDVVEGPAVG